MKCYEVVLKNIIEAELEGVLEERPSHTGLYDPVSLA